MLLYGGIIILKINNMKNSLNNEVKKYWENSPCGSETPIYGNLEEYTFDWFEIMENYRYEIEPFIHSIAQFSRHSGKRVLEIGVGAGTDHLQWARSGVDLYGVDLTEIGIEITKKRLKLYGFESNLLRADAEKLPYEDNYFDIVYSWGVIHHSETPELIIEEIRRVLKPNGQFIGMLYNRRSLAGIVAWLKFALLKGKPWRNLKYVFYHFNESLGTKAYTNNEIYKLFKNFKSVNITPFLTISDYIYLPRFLKNSLPNSLGYYTSIKAINKK